MWSALQHHIAPAIVVLEKHVDFDLHASKRLKSTIVQRPKMEMITDMDGFDLHILLARKNRS